MRRTVKNDLSGVKQLRKALILSIGATVILFLFLSSLFIVQISSLIHLSEDTDKSNKIIASVINLQKNVIDMETGSRGYNLTGQEGFLEPFFHGKKILPIQIRKINELLNSNFIYYHEMGEVQALLDKWIALQEKKQRTVSLTDEVNGKKIIDQFREITADILEQENKKLEANKIKRINNANSTIVYSVFLALILGVILAVIIRQQMVNLFFFYEQNYNHMMDAREKLESLNEDLEQKVFERTNALRAVNEELEAFCYSVSHDLRSPLRGIDGFSLALMEDYADKVDSSGQRYLQFIRDGVQRMGQLIDDLLRLSRINRSEVNFQYFDILEVVNEVIQNIKLSNVSLNVRFDIKMDEPQLIFADRGLMRIVIENLYQNAVKYSSTQPFPVLEFGRCHEQDLSDGGVTPPVDCFYLKDNGVGFDMEHYSKLFATFQRLHSEKEYPGSGIGLATVKRVLARHGGRIWAKSSLGQGATFYFYVPEPQADSEGGLHATSH